jgi:hypothetical protein
VIHLNMDVIHLGQTYSLENSWEFPPTCSSSG